MVEQMAWNFLGYDESNLMGKMDSSLSCDSTHDMRLSTYSGAVHSMGFVIFLSAHR